ncbi:hypothetical protein T10_3444, partial [Trichinella papuae]
MPASSRITPSQLVSTDFPMYRLAEVEIAAPYNCIREVAPNRRYQAVSKSQIIVCKLRLTLRIAALF